MNPILGSPQTAGGRPGPGPTPRAAAAITGHTRSSESRAARAVASRPYRLTCIPGHSSGRRPRSFCALEALLLCGGCARVGTTRRIRGKNLVGTRGGALGRTSISPSQSLPTTTLERYCPDFGDIKFGDRESDGVPKHVYVTFRRWKGDEYGDLPPRTLLIPRNCKDISFCAAFHLATWCKLCRVNGISDGPLFRTLTNGHHDFSRPFEGGRCDQSEIHALNALFFST